MGLRFIAANRPRSSGKGVPNVTFSYSELQARWFSKVLSDKVSLPSKEEMEVEIQDHKKRQEEGWIPSVYRSLQVSAVEYMEPAKLMLFLSFGITGEF